MNAFTEPGVLRRYQAELLDSGEFSVISPFSGARVVCRSSAEGIRGQPAYYFPGNHQFWLLVGAGSFQFGHPLDEAVLDYNLARIHLWRTKRPDRAIPSKEFRRLVETTRMTSDLIRKRQYKAALIVGHQNFAHQLWNELPALELWLHGAPHEAIAGRPIISVAEPLGSVRDIFPRLSEACFCAPPASLARFPLRVRVGAQRISMRVRRIVGEYCKIRGDSRKARRIVDTLSRGWPRVWISVRQGSRTPDNQSEFLLEVVGRIRQAYSDATFVFDGFTYPGGFSKDPGMLRWRDSFTMREKLDAQLIERLRDEIVCEFGVEAGLHLGSTSGLDVLEAINIAGYCNYYICHAGTLQHKVGWIHDTPGVIHTAPGDLEYVRRCAGIVESAIAPDILPMEFVAASSPPIGRQDIPRNYNYRIVDVVGAGQTVIAHMRKRLSGATMTDTAGSANVFP